MGAWGMIIVIVTNTFTGISGGTDSHAPAAAAEPMID